MWEVLAAPGMDVRLAGGVFWSGPYFVGEITTAGEALLAAVHLRFAQAAILDEPWRGTFDSCFARNIESAGDRAEDSVTRSGIRHVCRSVADEAISLPR